MLANDPAMTSGTEPHVRVRRPMRPPCTISMISPKRPKTWPISVCVHARRALVSSASETCMLLMDRKVRK